MRTTKLYYWIGVYLEMVRTNELPALTMDSCASLCLQVASCLSLTARTTSPGLNPACSPNDFKLTWNEVKSVPSV